MTLSASDNLLLWKAGSTKHLLHSSQKKAYDHFKKWRADVIAMRKAEIPLPGIHHRVFYLDISRRWGKDFLCLQICDEEARKRRGARILYCTAYESDVRKISIPLMKQFLESCPSHLQPQLKNNGDVGAGWYYPNGSCIQFTGLEKDPDSARGQWADIVVLSEAAFMPQLDYIMGSVLGPMLQGRPEAVVIINSTPAREPGHITDREYLGDAINRGAHFRATIEDNPRLSKYEIEQEIATTGGRDSERVRRELFCERIRLTTAVVLPEFDKDLHVKAFDKPQYGLGYTIIDPGVRDLCAVLCVVYDFERARLLVLSEWAKAGANTNEVAAALTECETKAFSGLSYWDRDFKQNPFQRYSDTDARLIIDLNTIHRIRTAAVDKTDAEASLHALRNAFQTGKIWVHSDCAMTIDHLNAAVWNKQRTSYERSPIYGHFDLLDCLKYGWRMVNRVMNPNPPEGVTARLLSSNPHDLWIKPSALVHEKSVHEKVRQALPRRRFKAVRR